MKTPEQIAAAVLTSHDAHGLRIDPSEVEQMLTAAIEADRAQRDIIAQVAD